MDIYLFMLLLLFVTRPAYTFLGALLQPISVLKGDDNNHKQKQVLFERTIGRPTQLLGLSL